MKTKSYNGYHTQTGVKLTGRWAEKPNATIERVVDKHGELGDHHAKIGKCKIDDKHVGCAAKSFGFGEQAAGNMKGSNRFLNNRLFFSFT
jgi:hypothetical protein